MQDDSDKSGGIFDLAERKEGDEQAAHPGGQKLRKLPKRFYKKAEAAPLEDGHTVLLDGKGVKTPSRRALVVPSEALARAMAEDWEAQTEEIDPRVMWLTRLANTALDLVEPRHDIVAEEIVKFGGSDLTCYRAEYPEGLVALQAAHWDPVLNWARDELGAAFVTTSGLIQVPQDADALDRLRRTVSGLDAFRVAALHNMTTLTGSALIALAMVRGRMDAEAVHQAAHVEEAWAEQLCGEDEEERIRLETRRSEIADTARFLALLDREPV
jgi:chaperone required for assembly of F1-ATPase